MSVFYAVEQNTLEWQQRRLGIPTSSGFEKILTPKKRERSAQAAGYMHRKLAEWIMGEPLEDEEFRNRWTDRGQALEDQAVSGYEGLVELETSPGGFWTLDDGMAGCSPDRLVGDSGVVEIKCPLLTKQVEGALQGVEADHICQIQGQLWITGRQWVDVFSFHPALMLPPKRVVRNDEFIEKLEKAVREFIEEMLRARADLEREYGPFVREGTPAPPARADDLITERDLDAIIEMRRQQGFFRPVEGSENAR